MSTLDNEILINEEKLKQVNQSTKLLKEKLSGVLSDISLSNKNMVSSSKGQFANAYKTDSENFEKRMQEYINKLDDIDAFAADVLELNTELDKKIALKMDIQSPK